MQAARAAPQQLLQRQQQAAEQDDDDSGELAGSLPGVDLSFMNGHDQPSSQQQQQQQHQSQQQRAPPSRASLTSSAESLASISSAPPNGLGPQHTAYAATRVGAGLSNGAADFLGVQMPPASGAVQLARRHSLSHELHSGSGRSGNGGLAFTPQGLAGRVGSDAAYSALAGGRIAHHGRSAGVSGSGSANAATMRHSGYGGISQALGLSMPFSSAEAAQQQQQQVMRMGGPAVRPHNNGQLDTNLISQQQQQQQPRYAQRGPQQQKGGPRLASQAPGRHQQPVRGVPVPAAVAPGADRARSPSVGPYFAANGHSAAFAAPAKDAALPSGFPNNLLNGLGGPQGHAGSERSGHHQLW